MKNQKDLKRKQNKVQLLEKRDLEKKGIIILFRKKDNNDNNHLKKSKINQITKIPNKKDIKSCFMDLSRLTVK